MNLFHLFYNLIGTTAGALAIPTYWFSQRKNTETLDRLHQRLGWYPPSISNQLQTRHHVWLHAVSVGEVGVACAITEALGRLLPRCQMAVSTTTRQGLARANALFKNRAACFYAPIDLLGPTDRALKLVRPKALVLLETELWPNLIVRAQRRGIRTVILNGRISVRAIKRYRKIRPLMRHVLEHVDVFSMISQADAERIHSLGASEDRIVVNGNAKFDGPDPIVGGQQAIQWAMELFGLTGDTPVFVAGSTREPEERTVLDAYLRVRSSFPELVLIIAPRHIERVAQIEYWVKERGLQCQRRSTLDRLTNPRRAPVVLLDTIGELSDTYSVARFVFCGGSLVPKGGQNLLEAAAWAKPIMYGPSMEDFADAQQLIEAAGGSIMVQNADQMAAVAANWLRRPHLALYTGNAGRRAILAHRGAAKKHAEVAMGLLMD
ncbi:MAG: hypothetical protein M0036_01555 [Desulfobacteraceae bacterium]|nr:hypothetical protein [Desulfobacteraceae bacterium]